MSGRRNRLEPEELDGLVLATGESRGKKVPPERLVAREPTRLFGFRLARAWAPPDEREVTLAVVLAHARAFERPEAVVNAAIQVFPCEPGPGALGSRLVPGLTSRLRCFFVFIYSRRNR
jgi:hypothetical protein